MRPSFAKTLYQEGAGNAGCAPHPQPCVQIKKHTSVVTTGTSHHPTFPAQWCYGLLRALVSDKSARMRERAVLTTRPSLDLSPFVLEGHKSLTGSVGQIRCLPQPEQLHGL